MASVTFPSAVGGDNSTVTDDADVNTGLRRGGYKTRFVPALTNTVNVANNAKSSAESALTSKTAAAASAAAALVSEQAAANFANAAEQTTLGFTTNRPTIRPSLNLDFVNQQVIDTRIVVDRASTKTYFAKRRVLVDENLLKYSEDFTNRAQTEGWSAANVTIAINNQTAPNGTLTADTITANGASAGHATLQNASVNNGYFSGYVKAGTNNFVQVRGNQVSDYANFDILNGTVGNVGAGVTAGIEASTNGFYRIWITGSMAASTIYAFHIITSNTAIFAETNTLNTSIILWGAQLETAKSGQTSPSAYVPNATAYPIRGYSNALETAVSGVMPIEFDPITQECLGIKPESQQTNLLLGSEEFDSANWGKTQGSVISNSGVSPDGTLTADRFVYNDNAASGYLSQPFTFLSNTSYVISAYFKQAGSISNVQLLGALPAMVGGANNVVVQVDLATGTVDFVSGTSATGGIQNVGGGWYRVYLAFTVTTGQSFSPQFAREYLGNVGNNFDGFLVWGAQLEASTLGVPSSYIKTTTAQATRLADKLTMPVSAFDFRQGEGTLYVESDTQVPTYGANFPRVAAFGTLGTVSETIYIAYTSDRIYYEINTGGVVQANQSALDDNGRGAPNRSVLAFKNDSVLVYQDGVSKLTDTSAAIPFVNTLFIGAQPSNVLAQPNGFIRSLKYFPKALSALEAQSLSQV